MDFQNSLLAFSFFNLEVAFHRQRTLLSFRWNPDKLLAAVFCRASGTHSVSISHVSSPLLGFFLCVHTTFKLRCRSWLRSLTERPPSLQDKKEEAEHSHLMQLITNMMLYNPQSHYEKKNNNNYLFELSRVLFSKQKVLVCSLNEPFPLPSQETEVLSQQRCKKWSNDHFTF